MTRDGRWGYGQSGGMSAAAPYGGSGGCSAGRRIAGGMIDMDNKPTLNGLFSEFMDGIAGQSATSRRNYRSRLEVFLTRYGHYQPRRIQRRHINNWHEWLSSRDLAGATQAGYRQALRAYFNWLVAEGYIDRNPAAHLKIGSYLPARHKLPSEADVERITDMVIALLDGRTAARGRLFATGEHEYVPYSLYQEAYPPPWRLRDAAIWLLLRGCGPRSGEIRNLRLSSLHRGLEQGPDEVGIYTMSSRGKTGDSIMRFDERTAQALRDWLGARPGNADIDRVFVSTRPRNGRYGPLTRSALGAVMIRLAKEAGVTRPIYPHALRHRIGHLTTKNHGPKVAALLLNHRDARTAATAIAFYHHPDDTDVARAVLALG